MPRTVPPGRIDPAIEADREEVDVVRFAGKRGDGCVFGEPGFPKARPVLPALVPPRRVHAAIGVDGEEIDAI
jgi:hypothetical protein